MNIALGAMACAVVVYLVSRFMEDETDRRRLGYAALVLLGLGVLLGAAPLLSNLQQDYEIKRAVSQNPALQALKKHEPQIFEQLISEAKAGAKQGLKPLEVQAKVRVRMSALIEKRLVIASDDVVAENMQNTVQEIRELQAGGDDACYGLLFPGSTPPSDLRSRFSKATVDADIKGLAKVIESAATAPQPPVPWNEVRAQLEPILVEVAQEYGADFKRLSVRQTDLAGRRKVCEITAEMFSKVLAAPNGGRLMRALLAAEH